MSISTVKHPLARTRREMRELLDAIQPGDAFRIVFRNRPPDKVRIDLILAGCTDVVGRLPKFCIGPDGVRDLRAAADTGTWAGKRVYRLHAKDGYEGSDAAWRLSENYILESIQRL